jgi:hypothetical protein
VISIINKEAKVRKSFYVKPLFGERGEQERREERGELRERTLGTKNAAFDFKKNILR